MILIALAILIMLYYIEQDKPRTAYKAGVISLCIIGALFILGVIQGLTSV